MVKLLGALLTVAAIAFVVREIWQSDFSSWMLLSSWQGGSILITVGVLYGMALIAIFWAWTLLLGQGRQNASFDNLVALYGRFQIYKYIPSNVIHQISRYAVLRKLGLSHKDIIWSSLAETGLIVLAAFLVSLAFGGLSLASSLPISYLNALFYLAICVAVLAALSGVFIPFVRAKLRSGFHFLYRRIRGIGFASFLYLSFFIATGLLLYWIVAETVLADATVIPPVGIVIAANALAWVAGTITPGAPGGVGVRELVLIASLTPFGLEGSAVAIAAQYRLATMVGDLVFFLGTFSAARLVKAR
ncbi:MAG: lysylphosphatidylglycerol synthase domain-containing protein [Litorimonas sp.]